MHLADRPVSIRRVMQHTIRVHHIETSVPERQVLAVGNHEPSVRSVEPETMSRDLDRAWRQIDPRAACATTRKLQQVGAHPATNLEQTRAAKLIEPHHARHPRRILVIAITLDLVKKFARAELVFAIVFGATRVLPPLLPHPQFFFSQPAHHPNDRYASSTLRALCTHVCSRSATSRAFAPNLTLNESDPINSTIALVSSSTFPGSTSNAVSRSTSTSPICPRQLATIPFPIAMYSKIFVGDPKNSLPSASGTCGATSMSHASNNRGTRSWPTAPVKITRLSPASCFSTSACKLPLPTNKNLTGKFAGINLIVAASFSTPCHGPNVPTNPATTSSSRIPNSRLASTPPTPARNRSTSTPFGLTTIFSARTPRTSRLRRSTSETTKIRAAASRFNRS